MSFEASKIPHSCGVWSEIEKFIPVKLENVIYVKFKAEGKQHVPELFVKYLEESDVERDYTLHFENDEIVTHLCNIFNLPTKTLNALSFELKPNELPVFDVKIYPYVTDTSEITFSYPGKKFLDWPIEGRCK